MDYTCYGTEEYIDYLRKIENIDPKSFGMGMDNIFVPDILSFDDDGTPVIAITGGLSRFAPNPFIKQFYGGTGYDEILNALERVEDSGAKTCRLEIDSPGGAAAGCQLVFNEIMEMRAEGIKFQALITGKALSAGYYIASACDEIFAESPEFQVGSIGTIVYTMSYRQMDEAAGIREIIIRSVNAPNKGQPIDTPEGAAIAQGMVDTYERFFLSAVATGRGIKIQDVVNRFGGGLVFVAKDPDQTRPDAISIGMIDGIWEDPDPENSTNKNDLFLTGPARIARNENSKKEEVAMKSLSEVFAAHPALRFEYDAAIAQARSEGKEEANKSTEIRVEAASKILESEVYGKEVKSIAAKVIAGKAEVSTLDSVVAMADMLAEKKKSDDAVNGTKKDGDTAPAAPANLDGKINSVDDYMARHKAIFGGGDK